MRYINKYLRNLNPYKLASHKVWEVSENERDTILKLDWNEATIPPAPGVKNRLLEILQNDTNYFLYPSTNNIELMSLLAEYTGLNKENVQIFPSSDVLHEHIVRMFVSSGDPILILGPTYDNFRLTCESQGGKIIYSNYNLDFTINTRKLFNDISAYSPSLVYICNPNNPSGNVIDNNFIIELLEEFDDTMFIIDEAYFEFYGNSMAKYVLEYNNLLISRTFSKAFAIANFRAGYLISNEINIKDINKIRNPKNICTFTQSAVIEVLKDTAYMYKYVDEVRDAKLDFEEFLIKFPFVKFVFKSEANFLLVEFINFEQKTQLNEYLIVKNIFVRNLTHCKELENTLRISIGTMEQMKRVKDEISNYYEHSKIS
jgi:histidinol-phosphate aminotransferase